MTYLYLDTETTGLNPGVHEVVELSYAVGGGEIYTLVLPHTLDHADARALEINRYHERGLANQAAWATASDVDLFLQRAQATVLVGANPRFDANFLCARLGSEPWSYRLWDVEAYAAGVFAWPEIRGLKAVRDHLITRGWALAAPDHSSAVDVLVTRQAHLALMAEARANQAH